jgi:hypothetical protein
MYVPCCSLYFNSSKLHCLCKNAQLPVDFYWPSGLELAPPEELSTSSIMSRADSSRDINALRDIFASLPRRLDDVLESSRVEAPEGNEEDERRRLRGSWEELDSDSLLVWNGMILEIFGWHGG